ncbi:MAG: DUF1003 domain-containing protein [Gammaproteobacteria bacterium]|nr:DUF1003 domain-containing protein [Gammaproteobacteria bacterium]
MPISPSLLRDVSIFRHLDDAGLAQLAAGISARSYMQGQTIFRTGDPGGEMHLVNEGRVELSIEEAEGKRLSVAVAEMGEIFGELSLLDGQPRSARAVALIPTVTAVIAREDLKRLFELRPEAALDLLAAVSGRLRESDLMLAENMGQNANEVIEERLTLGDRIADNVARFGGSWFFINAFVSVMVLWMGLNAWQWFAFPTFDPPPFIGLNLVLSMLAALQAPIIMMSQNRQDAKDRVRAEVDYEVNVRAELEVMQLHQKVDRLMEDLSSLTEALHAGRR